MFELLSPAVQTYIAVFVVSLASLVGVFLLGVRKETIQGITLYFVSFAVGAMLGGAFFHLLPEVYEHAEHDSSGIYCLVAGFVLFFVLEKLLRWRHCHVGHGHHTHPFVIMNLVGDGLHNLLDGMLIAGCFMTDPHLGLAVAVAVLFHEIPQEIGDFGILIHGGWSIKKALFFNFLSALTALLGAAIVLELHQSIPDISLWLTGLTAGSFIYIAGSDLIPELRHDTGFKKSFLQLVFILLGMLAIALPNAIAPHAHGSAHGSDEQSCVEHAH